VYSIIISKWKLNRTFDSETKLDNYSFTAIQSFSDIGNYLVDDTLEISDRMDYGEPFEYGGLDASFTIIDNPIMDLIKADFAELDYFYTCEIKKDGEDILYGLLNKENLDYDRRNKDYQLNITSLFAFVYGLENRMLPPVTAIGNSNLTFLDTPLLNIFGDLINSNNGIVIDIPLNTSLTSPVRYINQINYMSARSNGLTVKQFLDEVLKKFIGYLDIMPNKRLQLISYNKASSLYPAIDITNLIQDTSYTERVYTSSKYLGAIVNYNYPREYDRDEEIALGGAGQPTTGIEVIKGYAYIKYDGNATTYLPVDFPENVLDLREKTLLVDDNFVENTEILIFFVFTEQNLESRESLKSAYELVKRIINPQKIVECTLVGNNFHKFQRVIISGEEYVIKEIKKNDQFDCEVTLTSII